MKIHRFYIGSESPKEIQHFGAERAWVQDSLLRHQWTNVLRLRPGEEVVLFDDESDILYRIAEIKDSEIALDKVTVMKSKRSPGYLLAWSLVKKDNSDFILQKCTEIGISRFVPLISQRTEKQGFDIERAKKIVIEATEQCGRSDIAHISEPTLLEDFLNTYKESYTLFAAHPGSEGSIKLSDEVDRKVGVVIGPEGGWSEDEQNLFTDYDIPTVGLGDFVLRTETAAIVAAAKMAGV